MTLEADIAAWDFKSSDDIGRIYRRYSVRPSLGAQLAVLISEHTLERGASWLLKHHLETGWPDITPTDIATIYDLLPDLEHWEARLHFLQCIPHLPIPGSHVKPLEQFLRDAVSDKVKFVRAWGYNGWHQLGIQYPGYRPQVIELLETARASETAPSVKVRVRKALEAGF